MKSFNIGLYPTLLRFNLRPINTITTIGEKVFKENTLGTSIAFTEWMYNIEFTIEVSKLSNKLLLFKVLKIALRLKLFKKLIGLNFNTAKGTKACVTFGDVNLSKLTSPFIKV